MKPWESQAASRTFFRQRSSRHSRCTRNGGHQMKESFRDVVLTDPSSSGSTIRKFELAKVSIANEYVILNHWR
jgi:hypothetical protein